MALQNFIPGTLWRVPTRERVLYLTFDDGPVPEVTPFVLATLADYEAKATFFCLGKNAAANPELLLELQKQGHTIGNHTQNHPNAWKTGKAAYDQEVKAGQKTLSSLTGQEPVYFRPPYGKLRWGQFRKYGKQYEKVVMWDVLSYDWQKDRPKEAVLQRVLKKCRNGSIIVFHDSVKAQANMSYALPRMLAHFRAMDYRFAPLTPA